MLNRIILMGRLTRDPELRHTQTGTPVASFSLAVDRTSRTSRPARRPPILSTSWPGGRRLSSSPASSPRAAWPWWRAGCRSVTGPTGTAASAAAPRSSRTTSILAIPSGTRGRRLFRPLLRAQGGYAPPPAPAPSTGYAAPAGPAGNEFGDLTDDDGELPF